ncbi:MAG: alginate lyase family protein [Woeseiaceae bacterium]
MILRNTLAITLLFSILAVPAISQSTEHPSLIMTKEGVERIRAELGNIPLFDASLKQAQVEMDAEIELGIDTPIPKDYFGGYTHDRHKKNFFMAQKAGVLWQILEDEKYAEYVRDMLFQYEAMYKNLPKHPQTRSYARGKLFWQCLNDSNWLVYMSQAYDSIYNWLSAEERTKLEDNLFRPFADYISLENPRFFNRVHNHSTWGNAAVGMIGLVMDDDELVQRALYGMPFDEIDLTAKDDDGGLFWKEGQKAGFLANLDEPFSPDGYYTEGPYYQRYAMYPFLAFAQGLHNTRPDEKIFEYKNGVLLNAVNALLNLTDADGEFFPLNDGQKGMSYYARELVTAVNIAYHVGDQDPQLLSIAEKQGQVLLDDSGFAVAMGIRDGKAQPFAKASINLSDGADGKQGGVAILRQGDEELTLVFKYAAQGLSHGHYDKLSYSLYEKGDEVLQDYGLSRFVNIGQKGGGNYLPENASWAKQTIAHNTVTQNETSHFEGKYEIGSQHHSELHFFDASNADVQVASAIETNAYPGTQMQRTVALVRNKNFEKPFLLDIFKLKSGTKNQYDLPFYFIGQVLQVNFDYDSPESLGVLGDKNGYQHLYLEREGKSPSGNSKFLWMDNRKFYSLTSATDASDELLFARIGANDPDYNLRRDAALIIRRKGAADTVFASVIEAHGSYNYATELAVNSNSNIAELNVVYDAADYTAVSIEDLRGNTSMFVVSNNDSSESTEHKIEIGDKAYRWNGPYHYASQ